MINIPTLNNITHYWLREIIKLPGEPGGKELEAKISMFADDTQLFNKDECSVEKSFDILSEYEKASGSRINYNKTKAISIGTARDF